MTVNRADTATVTPLSTLRRELVEFVERRVESRETAEDIVHDVLARLQQVDADKIRDPKAWLYRASRNAIVDHYRTRKSHAPLSVDLEVDEVATDSGPNEATRELALCLRPLIIELPSTYRRALQLVDLDGMTQAGAAELEGLSVSGMKSRVQRGRRLLAQRLSACCRVELSGDGAIDGYSRAGDCGC